MATQPKGLSLRQILKTTPRLFHNNSEDVVIKKLEHKKTKGGQNAIVSHAFSPDSKDVKPHKQLIIGLDKDPLSLKGLKISKCKRIKCSCSCSSFLFSGAEWANHLHGASDIIYGNGQPATVSNPSNVPMYCKHLVKLANKIIEKNW
jgi:hypothetical protein